MTHASLIACPGCARHVRVGEVACPFCRTSLEEVSRAFTARLPPGQRLSRAALYAFGVGSLTVAAACGGSVSGGTGDKDAGDEAGMVGLDAAYGGSPPDGFSGGQPLYGAPFDAAFFYPDAGQDVTVAPPYGISPPFDAGDDAGDDTDAGDDASDAGQDADVGVAVPYGVPPGGG
jgi:hypothetical protein